MHAAPPRLIQRDRLKAPREHLGVLAEPLTLLRDAATGALLEPRRPPDAAIGQTSLSLLRESLRSRLGWRGPVIATGHQAEFFHAGVLAKTIAAALLAQARGGTAVYLTVDSDTPKSTQIAIPDRGESGLERRQIVIPGIDVDLPMESQRAARESDWTAFFNALATATSEVEMLSTFRGAFIAATRTGDLSGAFAVGQNAVLSSLDLPPVTCVKMSQIADGPEFRTFAAHWLANAAPFAAHYNAAQLAYRERNGVRNWQRPAPPLTIEGDRVETPLWAYRATGARCKLFAARASSTSGAAVQLFADHTPIGTSDALADGWHIRPKALLLSAFARLVLGDLFLHGIGGAKYDEMTEDFIRACFGCEPGAMACVSATLHLLPPIGVSGELAAAEHRLRDFAYNPQRYGRDFPPRMLLDREAAITRVLKLRAERAPRAQRRAAFDSLRTAIGNLAAAAQPAHAALLADRDRLAALSRENAIATDREYFYGLHRRSELATLLGRIRAALGVS